MIDTALFHFMNKKQMKISLIIVWLCILIGWIPGQEWSENVFPVSELQPGMRGYLKTVFYGETIEQVGVEVLDVMRNYYPQCDIILVRLFGEKAETNGVVNGMSGSPVYIEDKLVGALAYRYGEFMKEPIGGVMP
ncbi:MAG: hypothetical protein EHM72_14790, partial [Calditrichaeota bacterium]